MSGPHDELGRLLDIEAPRPDQATLDAIVRRHRHRQQRHLKQVTTVSVVVAAAAVGVSVSGALRPPPRRSALPPVEHLRAEIPKGGAAKALGQAPKGLRWAVVGRATSRRSFAALTPAPVSSASSSTTTSPSSGVRSGGPMIAICTAQSCGTASSGALTPLFDRTAGGIELRALTESELPIMFEPESTTTTAPTTTAPTSTTTTAPTTTSAPAGNSGSTGPVSGVTTPVGVDPGGPVLSCDSGTALVVEASDAGAIGTVVVPLGATTSGAALDLVDATVLGSREGAPMIVVVAHVEDTVATVSATFADGTTDEMAPDDGWVVLGDAVSSSASISTAGESVVLSASDAQGNSLESTTIPSEPAYAVPVGCVEPLTAVPATGTVPATSSEAGGPVNDTTVTGDGRS